MVHDQKTGAKHTPLQSITATGTGAAKPAQFTVVNSLLSEFAALGYEVRYLNNLMTLSRKIVRYLASLFTTRLGTLCVYLCFCRDLLLTDVTLRFKLLFISLRQ